MFHFGFSYVGVLYLLMLFFPNFLWTKYLPEGYEDSAKKENKVLLTFERIGEVLTCVIVLVFSDFLCISWNLWLKCIFTCISYHTWYRTYRDTFAAQE